SIYPNPANAIIAIESSIVEPYTIQLLNMLGETVYGIQEMVTGKTTIDLGILPKGIYIVQLLDKEGNTINRQRLVRE
ncbi:MAG: T9SS type A sorting domain-containing protein, partial [Bacteroidia bacterium]|nr:T9SS type A sorting domain-containing protein [Bacteroidia bacterium]